MVRTPMLRAIVMLSLAFGGCSKESSVKSTLPQTGSGTCMSAPAERPLESCASSLDSLQAQAKKPRLKSTELTAGQYSYSSGEIFIDRVLPSGERLRVHAKESLCIDPATNRGFPRIDLVCQESVTKNTQTYEIKQYAPRLIGISSDERKADVAFRGAIVKTPAGTLSYQFEDIPPKMGMSRADFQKNLNQSFDESYFVRQSEGVYLFIGKKRMKDGSTETIRMTLNKVGGENPKGTLLKDPIPDRIFKF